MSLLSHLPEQDSPRVIAVKPELPAPTPIRANGTKPSADPPVYSPSVVYVLELATILALRDEETITTLGAEVARALQAVICDAERLHPVSLSRCVFYLLSLLRASNDHGYIRAPVVLHSISSFREDLLKECASPILKGLLGCVSGPPELKKEVASSPDFWSVLRSLQSISEAAGSVFSIVEGVIAPVGTQGAATGTSAITPDNYDACVALLNAFATAGSIGARQEQQREKDRRSQGRHEPTAEKKPQKSEAVVHGTKAIALVSQVASRVPTLIKQSHLETDQAWRTYWSPVFNCLARQCVNPCREIRHQSFTCLQRCLLSADLASPDHTEWTNIFGEVLLPLINQLLKPEVYQTDPVGMSETRVQAAQMLCKIFLHYLVLLTEWDDVLDLWVKILAIMDRLMNSGQSDMLVEAVPESLKNILHVMSSGGQLVAPPIERPDQRTDFQQQLWTETYERLERFLPSLMKEVFPDATHRPLNKRASQAPRAPEMEAEEGSSEEEEDENPSKDARSK